MAAINDLISRIQDPELRAQIQAEVNKLSRQKKFGLVCEDHIPECTPLYELPIRVGTLVAKKDGSVNDLMMVTAITDGKATCIYQKDGETVNTRGSAGGCGRFGEPIYPYLQPSIPSATPRQRSVAHLIQADNYHALQLLEYLYAGQVTVSTSTRPIIPVRRTGSTITTMWTAATAIGIANGCPSWRSD